MIDWIEFIDSLDADNFDEIIAAVQCRMDDDAQTEASTIVLSFAEVDMARENKMKAIISLRARLDCTPLVAKHAVEQALEKEEEDFHERFLQDEGDVYQEDGDDTVTPLGEAADDFQDTILGADAVD